MCRRRGRRVRRRTPLHSAMSAARRSRSPSSLARCLQAIAHAPHGVQQLRTRGRIDFAAEQVYERVKRVALDAARVAPYGFDQGAAKHGEARAPHEEMQEIEFPGAQLDLLSAAGDDTP